MIKKIKIFKIKSFKSYTGSLTPITFKKNFPFFVKRIFFLYGKKNKIRGNHAHKKCSQFFIPIYGNAVLTIKTNKKVKKIPLKRSTFNAVLIPPNYWCSIKFLNQNSIIMVACDRFYETNDYIKNFNLYLKHLRKK